jgi:polyphosphate kinase
VDKIFRLFKNNIERSIFKEILVSPFNLRRKMIAMIDAEIAFAKQGQPAEIIIKLNNLVDSKMIRKLYEASKAGVKIKCIVRGICAIIPGVAGLSENITIRSVVGQYLEHSRIIIFKNGGAEKYFISSADWMTRNLDRRIEVTVPVLDKNIQQDLKYMINMYLADNQKARTIDALQKNKNVKSDIQKKINSQHEIYTYFKAKQV